MAFEEEFRDLTVRYNQELAQAVRMQPAFRRRIMRVDGLLRFQLRVIETVFVTGTDLTENAMPVTPDKRWPTKQRVFNEDIWLLLSSGTEPYSLWGAKAISAASMIRKVFKAAEVLTIEAFGVYNEFPGQVQILASQVDTPRGAIPETIVSSLDVVVHMVTSGVRNTHDVFQTISDEDFPREQYSEVRELEYLIDETDLNNIGPEAVASFSTAATPLQECLREIVAGRPVTLGDTLILRQAMEFSAAWSTAASKAGAPEPWPSLIYSIDAMILEVKFAMGPSAVPTWQLWDQFSDDGLPLHPETGDAWWIVFEFFKRKEGPSHPLSASPVAVHDAHPATIEHLDHVVGNKPHAEWHSADKQKPDGYPSLGLMQLLGIGRTKLFDLRTDLKCKKSKRGYPILIDQADAMKIAGHLVEEYDADSDVGQRARKFVDSVLRGHEMSPATFNVANDANDATSKTDHGI